MAKRRWITQNANSSRLRRNQTYHSVFDDPTPDVELDYSSSVVTRCGTHE
jgi:hypothetical protein